MALPPRPWALQPRMCNTALTRPQNPEGERECRTATATLDTSAPRLLPPTATHSEATWSTGEGRPSSAAEALGLLGVEGVCLFLLGWSSSLLISCLTLALSDHDLQALGCK